MRPVTVLAALLLFSSVFACAHSEPLISLDVGELTLVSTRATGLVIQKGARVEGKDCANLLLSFIPVEGLSGNIKVAVDNALEGTDGNMIVEAVISQYGWFFPPIWTQQCLKVVRVCCMGRV